MRFAGSAGACCAPEAAGRRHGIDFRGVLLSTTVRGTR
jgi:hypothetical protein